MAKLSARGQHKVGQVTTKFRTSRYVFALRSDGKVLERLAGFYNENGLYTPHATGYKEFGTLKLREGATKVDFSDVERLSSILTKRGHKILEVAR